MSSRDVDTGGGRALTRPIEVSLVMPCFNAEAWLGTQLESLARQRTDCSWELVVADNGSTDSSIEILESFRDRLPQLNLIDASACRGIGFARNRGVDAAQGRFIVFVDQDDELDPDCLQAMVLALAEHEVVIPRQDFKRLNPEWLWKARPNAQAEGLVSYDYPPFLPHASGACLGIRRQLHVDIGGFGEPLETLEDTDYCWRLQLAGHELVFVPTALFHYRLRDRLPDIFRQAAQYGTRNIWAYKKYRSQGMPELPSLAGVRKWVSCLLRLPTAMTRSGRAKWVWSLGWRVGRLRGCWRYRIWAP